MKSALRNNDPTKISIVAASLARGMKESVRNTPTKKITMGGEDVDIGGGPCISMVESCAFSDVKARRYGGESGIPILHRRGGKEANREVG